MRLLLVENYVPLADELMVSLTHQGHAVDWLANDCDAAVQGTSEPYDPIILDFGLPGRPGLEILQEQRGLGFATPVLILIVRGPWTERIDGLKAGAGDYLTKPPRPEELVLRIRALLRRAHGLANQNQLEAAGLHLDEQCQCACLNGADVDPIAVELRLLRHFMLHPGRVLSKRYLAGHLYDGKTECNSNVIEIRVNHLRRRLSREVIKTRRGQGYRYTGVAAG